MLTSAEIQNAKQKTRYSTTDRAHEHDDCIRIAYEWLDAQMKTKTVNKKGRALKHIIEKWGGRYVSQSDVEVAATLHKDIIGKYPYYNLSSRMVLPHFGRLADISEANKHPSYKERLDEKSYSAREGS